jgi:uncharacterized protein YwqG
VRRLAVALVAGALLVGAAPAGAAVPGVGDVARETGLGRMADRLEAAAELSLRMHLRRVKAPPAARGTTRIGGGPDLPAGTRWPRCKGRPMTFIGQVRLDDLPPTELPRTGLLSMFVDVETEYAGIEYGLDAGACAKVLHVAPGTPLTRRAFDRRRFHLRPSLVAFRPEATVPWPGEAPLTGLEISSDADFDAWDRFYRRLSPVRDGRDGVHRLLGYGLGVQGDPRLTCAGNERDVQQWRQLLELDHDLATGFEVADGGRLHLLVRADDLRRDDVTRVCPSFASS